MRELISQERDGFHVRENEFNLPDDTWKLNWRAKRVISICDLFVNHQYSISDIVRALDEDHDNIIQVLLEEGIIRERRVKNKMPPHGIGRRKSDKRS